MIDQEIMRKLVDIKTTLEVHQMVLIQFVGSVAGATPEPQKAIASLRDNLIGRLDKAPPPTGPAQAAYLAEVRTKLEALMARLESELDRTADPRSKLKRH